MERLSHHTNWRGGLLRIVSNGRAAGDCGAKFLCPSSYAALAAQALAENKKTLEPRHENENEKGELPALERILKGLSL